MRIVCYTHLNEFGWHIFIACVCVFACLRVYSRSTSKRQTFLHFLPLARFGSFSVDEKQHHVRAPLKRRLAICIKHRQRKQNTSNRKLWFICLAFCATTTWTFPFDLFGWFASHTIRILFFRHRHSILSSSSSLLLIMRLAFGARIMSLSSRSYPSLSCSAFCNVLAAVTMTIQYWMSDVNNDF